MIEVGMKPVQSANAHVNLAARGHEGSTWVFDGTCALSTGFGLGDAAP